MAAARGALRLVEEVMIRLWIPFPVMLIVSLGVYAAAINATQRSRQTRARFSATAKS
jgi:hypothetical protein